MLTAWMPRVTCLWLNVLDYAVHWHIFIYLLLKLIRSRWRLAITMENFVIYVILFVINVCRHHYYIVHVWRKMNNMQISDIIIIENCFLQKRINFVLIYYCWIPSKSACYSVRNLISLLVALWQVCSKYDSAPSRFKVQIIHNLQLA